MDDRSVKEAGPREPNNHLWDLLSQAEHGTDSQVVLIAIDLSESELQAIEDEVHKQAHELPRVDIVRGAIEHSVTISVSDMKEALKWSNYYVPTHWDQCVLICVFSSYPGKTYNVQLAGYNSYVKTSTCEVRISQ